MKYFVMVLVLVGVFCFVGNAQAKMTVPTVDVPAVCTPAVNVPAVVVHETTTTTVTKTVTGKVVARRVLFKGRLRNAVKKVLHWRPLKKVRARLVARRVSCCQ